MTDTYTPETDENGTRERAKRVKFGSKPNQSVPHEWAEVFMTWVHENRADVFRDALMVATDTHIPLTVRRKRGNGAGES